MKNKLIMGMLVVLTILSSVASALDIKYTRTKTQDGDKVIRAELVDQYGNVVATGHSSGEGSRKEKKKDALEDAVDDLDNK